VRCVLRRALPPIGSLTRLSTSIGCEQLQSRVGMFCCLLASSCSRFGSLPCPEAPQVESRSADYNMLSKRYRMRKSAAAARRKVGRLDEVEKDISTGRLSGCWKSLPFPPGRSSFARCPPRVGVCRACLGRKFSPALSARVIVSCFVVFLVTDEGQTRDEAEVLLCYFSIFPPNPTIRGTLGKCSGCSTTVPCRIPSRKKMEGRHGHKTYAYPSKSKR